MYTLLLADDEPLELETLKDYIPWDTVGVGEVLTAANGREALELSRSHKVDLVITDIKMPIMDGIEFARQFSAENSAAKVIFLSGYDDFDCVHSAYKAGGVDYILKPFVKNEVLRVVQTAREQLENDRGTGELKYAYLEELLSRAIFGGDTDTAAKELCKSSAFAKIDGLCLLSIDTNATHIQFKEALRPLNRYCYAAHNHTHTHTVLALPAANRMDNIISRLRDSLTMHTGVRCRFICSRNKTPLDRMHEVWMRTREYRRYFFYLPETDCLDIDTFDPYEFSDRLPDSLMRLLNSAAENRPRQLRELAEQYILETAAHRVAPELVIEHAIDIVLRIAAAYPAGEQRLSKQQLMDSILSAGDIAAVRQLFCNMLDELDRRVLPVSDKNDRLVAEILKRIDCDYASGITADSLAKEVYLSPNYLRSVFKEKTGATLHECITKRRMEKAAELLEGWQYKVKEIGRMVGYDSESYFCAAFLKHYHTTPNNYKNRSKGAVT